MSDPHGAKPMAQADSITTRMRVQGMDCAGCAIKIENALRRMPGVTEVNVSVAGGTVTVRHDQADTNAMSSQIAGLGYTVTGSEEVGANTSTMIMETRSKCRRRAPAIPTSTTTAARTKAGGKPARVS